MLSNCCFAQKLSKIDKATIGYLKSNLSYLASDELEGRRAGDKGEKLAVEFIAAKFAENKLVPKGDSNTYIQTFPIFDGKFPDSNTMFTVDNTNLKLFEGFFPFPFSASTNINLEFSPSINEKDQPWFFDINELIEQNASNPHYDLIGGIYETSKKLKFAGATAVIFYYTGTGVDPVKYDSKNKDQVLDIPVFYLTKDNGIPKINDFQKTHNFNISSSIKPSYRYGHNVIGLLDNKAKNTIIIGAHLDHLGYGQDGNSMVRSGPLSIHNGADDNASGSSGLIELGFLFRKSKYKKSNILFIGFSGEELGLNGSKYFTEHPTVSFDSVNYMINMDMIGRLNDSTKVITIGGFGTSPVWSSRLTSIKTPLSIKTDSSGTGPSDHTSFYRKNIPVLFFFTGLHTDYHKPSDDSDKINYLGLYSIIQYIHNLIKADNGIDKIPFLKTREQQTSTSARFSVSLGIMPDYSFTQTGVRVDGVSDNRPAKSAGIIPGDIILQVGDFKTSSVEAYMQALSKFKKGDKTQVIYSRKGIQTTVPIEFK